MKPRKKVESGEITPTSSAGSTRHTSTEPNSVPPTPLITTFPQPHINQTTHFTEDPIAFVEQAARNGQLQHPKPRPVSKHLTGNGAGSRVVLTEAEKRFNHRYSEDCRRKRVNSKYKELADVYMPEFHGNSNSEKEITAGICQVAWNLQHRHAILSERCAQAFGDASLRDLCANVTPMLRRPSISEGEEDADNYSGDQSVDTAAKLKAIKAMLAMGPMD